MMLGGLAHAQGAAGADGKQAMPRGDVTGDLALNADDVLAVLLSWGACELHRGQDCQADLDADGSVALADLLLVLSEL
jgi:hypothetical protein